MARARAPERRSPTGSPGQERSPASGPTCRRRQSTRNPAGTRSSAKTSKKQIEGPGGIWLEQKGDVAPPSAPQLTSTDPASPNPSGTPRIRGTAEAGSTVRVYAGASCAGAPVATGSAAELGSPGIRVEVGEGVTAAFSATATDAAGNTSACSASISYTRPPHGDPPGPAECIVPTAGRQEAGAGEVGVESRRLCGRKGDEAENEEGQKTRSARRQVIEAFRGECPGGRQRSRPEAWAEAAKSTLEPRRLQRPPGSGHMEVDGAGSDREEGGARPRACPDPLRPALSRSGAGDPRLRAAARRGSGETPPTSSPRLSSSPGGASTRCRPTRERGCGSSGWPAG